jgi:hypothetical protein
MVCERDNLCPEFSSIETNAFKRKIYETCLIYAMENYAILKSNFECDPFPCDKYYSLDDILKNVKVVGKPTKIIKKKKSPVTVDEKKNTDCVETDETPVDKKKRKVYPLTLNRNTKTVIDFIIGRFLWEIYYIEPDGDVCPESKHDIEEYILNGIVSKDGWSRTCNITQLIKNCVQNLMTI